MERCDVCGRDLDPATGACPVCGPRYVPPPAETRSEPRFEPDPEPTDEPTPEDAYEPSPEPAPTVPPPLPPPSPPAYEAYRAALPLVSGNDPSRLAEAKELGWNWGAFFVPYLWLVGHGRLGLGLFLILSTGIPFVAAVHLLLYPAAALYLGFHGYELAWKYEPYHSVAQLRDREREWSLWGLFLVVLVFLAIAITLLYVRVILEQALSSLDQLGF